MKTFVLVLIAASGLVSAGAPEGKAVFEAKCQPCHGPKGEGKAAIAKMFKVEMHPLGIKGSAVQIRRRFQDRSSPTERAK